MDDLNDLVRGYLTAEGWNVTRGPGLLRGDRESSRGDDEQDHIYVWVPGDVGQNFASREGPHLRYFQEAAEDHPTAEKVLLVSTPEGLSRNFRHGANQWFGVKTLVPSQFFDRDFKWERDGRAASATSELRSRGEAVARERIAQPHLVRQSPDSNVPSGGSDLLDVLRERLREPQGRDGQPTIHVVVGPAGMGKSFLFEALYARLYADFQDDKRSQRLSPRPFALLPEHLDDASAATIGSLLDAYLRTEFTRPLDREVFNWKLVNGMGIWLLDGLDEILERDHHFFDQELMELMTLPFGASPPIVVCVRDSLFETHKGLRDFCEEYRDHVVVYELSQWDRPNKVALARKDLGASGASAFIDGLARRPALDVLASTPYYCKLLIEEFDADGAELDYSELDILNHALDRIVKREREKGLLDLVPSSNVREFITSCAGLDLSEGFRGLLVDDVREYAEAALPPMRDEEVDRFVTQMSQIPLFTRGESGRLRFAQEPLEHHLVADYVIQSLQDFPEGCFNTLGRSGELPENVIRLIAEAVARSASWSAQRVVADVLASGRPSVGGAPGWQPLRGSDGGPATVPAVASCRAK